MAAVWGLCSPPGWPRLAGPTWAASAARGNQEGPAGSGRVVMPLATVVTRVGLAANPCPSRFGMFAVLDLQKLPFRMNRLYDAATHRTKGIQMEPHVGNQLVGAFVKFKGETVAELKSRPIADVDLELLRLRRIELKERIELLEVEVAAAVKTQKCNVDADLASRGLLNSTIKPSMHLAVDHDANKQLDNARREHNRALEEIAIMERRIREGMTPSWKRLWRWFFGD